MFVVLSDFADLQDGNHIYRIGDEYPREGYSPKDERIDELSTGKNLLHKPLIKKLNEVITEAEAEEEPKRKRGRKPND